MNRKEIDSLLNPKGDADRQFQMSAAIEHIQSKTNREFKDGNGDIDLPTDLVKAVETLVDSADNPANVSSESVGSELSVSYFSNDATESVQGYWKPYRRLMWS